MKDIRVTPFVKFVFLTLLLYPILSIYGCGITNWSLASLINLFLALLLIPRIKIEYDIKLMPQWLLWLFVDAAIVFYLSSNSILIPLSVIQTFLTFLVYFYYIRPSNITTFLNIYRKTVIICLSFFYLQYICYQLFGIKISGIISFLPIALNYDADWLALHNESERFSSFFSEPAHFVYFLMPLICIELYRKKINWIFVFLLFLAVLLSSSGTGLLVLVVAAGVWYLNGISFKKTQSIIRAVLVGVIFIIGAAIFLKTDVAANLMERKTETSIEYEGGSRSGFMRLWRGYYVYAFMPLSKQIVGLDNDELLQKYEQNSLFASTFTRDTDHFYNGMSMLLVKQGLVGLLIFFLLIREIWKKSNKEGHLILICFIAYMLMESVYLNYRMAFYFIMAWCMVKENIQRISVLSPTLSRL